jgi:putative SOS response-associated peptidase YedK
VLGNRKLFATRAALPFFAPRYNIAPTQMAPVIYRPPSSDFGAANCGGF